MMGSCGCGAFHHNIVGIKPCGLWTQGPQEGARPITWRVSPPLVALYLVLYLAFSPPADADDNREQDPAKQDAERQVGLKISGEPHDEIGEGRQTQRDLQVCN